ncbi:MAG: gamma-glutamyltransferase, partial [Bacteroidota bacterium]
MLKLLRPLSVISSFLIFSFLLISGCESADDNQVSYSIPEQPEMSTGYTEKPGWVTNEFAVAAANPLATDAGYQIIQAG